MTCGINLRKWNAQTGISHRIPKLLNGQTEFEKRVIINGGIRENGPILGRRERPARHRTR
jgi:hypothetical protein